MASTKLLGIDNFYLKVSAYYKQEFNGYIMPIHYHNYFEIMYVEEGSCEVVAQSGTGYDKIVMHKNEFIFIDCNVKHMLFIKSNTKCTMYNIEFSLHSITSASKFVLNMKDILNNSDSIRQTLSRHNYILAKDVHFIKSTISRIQNTYDSMQGNSHLKNYNALQQLLIGELFLEIDKCCSRLSVPSNHYIKKICEYINANFQNDITITDLANHINVHPTYIHKLFKSGSADTVHKFINRVRIEKSIELMKNTSLPLTDIALEVGFNSRQSFFNAFIKEESLSPSEYKKQNIKSNKWEFSGQQKS